MEAANPLVPTWVDAVWMVGVVVVIACLVSVWRDRDLSTAAKAYWSLAMVLLPPAVLGYLVVRVVRRWRVNTLVSRVQNS